MYTVSLIFGRMIDGAVRVACLVSWLHAFSVVEARVVLLGVVSEGRVAMINFL